MNTKVQTSRCPSRAGRKRIIILRDTREQRPLDFSAFADEGVSVEAASLWPGDYSFRTEGPREDDNRNFSSSFAVERKSVSDLVGTMVHGYAGIASIRRYESRFDLELENLQRFFDRYFVVIEPDPPEVLRNIHGNPEADARTQIERGWYRANIEPTKICAFLDSLVSSYGCHVYLAANREDAAGFIVEQARRYANARRHVIHRGKVAAQEREAKGAREEISPF